MGSSGETNTILKETFSPMADAIFIFDFSGQAVDHLKNL